MIPLMGYVFKAALRDKFILSLLAVTVLTLSLSLFFGSTAITEKDQFVKAFVAYGIRLLSFVGLTLFIINYIRRSFEARDVEYLLSRPISRIHFVLSQSVAYTAIATSVVLIFLLVSFFFLPLPLTAPQWTWFLSLWVELVIMANVAMFFAFVISSASMATLAVFGFYILCRLMGQILGIISKETMQGVLSYLSKVMEVISIFIPRLDMMAQSKWILYTTTPDISLLFMLGQGVVFTSLIVLATMIDLVRREF